MFFHPPPHFRHGLSPENKLREEMLKEEEAERETIRDPRDFTLYTMETPSEPLPKPTDPSKDPRDFTRHT